MSVSPSVNTTLALATSLYISSQNTSGWVKLNKTTTKLPVESLWSETLSGLQYCPVKSLDFQHYLLVFPSSVLLMIEPHHHWAPTPQQNYLFLLFSNLSKLKPGWSPRAQIIATYGMVIKLPLQSGSPFCNLIVSLWPVVAGWSVMLAVMFWCVVSGVTGWFADCSCRSLNLSQRAGDNAQLSLHYLQQSAVCSSGCSSSVDLWPDPAPDTGGSHHTNHSQQYSNWKHSSHERVQSQINIKTPL